MIWSRLLILIMISNVGWDFIVWFEGVNLAGGDKSILDLKVEQMGEV